MSIISAFVLFAVFWFMTFLVILPIRIVTQGDAGEVVPGTHASAPEHHHLKKKALITTAIAFVLWVIVGGIVLSGWISVRDFDWFNRMGPPN
jgi:predicted secreted protein